MSQKNKIDGYMNSGRANWTDEQFVLFVDICVRGTNDGFRAGGTWGNKGWQYIEKELKCAGYDFTRSQLKSKWSWMKEQFKLWRTLIGSDTGLGWDPVKGTVDASEKWWKDKIKNFPECAKLRGRGIGQELYDKYCLIFMGGMATGEYARTPSSMNIDDITIQKEPNIKNIHEVSEDSDYINHSLDILTEKSKSEGSEEVISQMNQKKRRRSEASNSSPKRKNNHRKGKKKLTTVKKFSDSIKILCNSLESNAESRIHVLKHTLGDKPSCGIGEVMADILSLPGFIMRSEKHSFAMSLMESKEKREMYNTLINIEDKLWWLDEQYKNR